MAGQFVAEADVAKRPVAEMKAVDPDIAVLHHAVELDENGFVRIRFWQTEMLAIPADAAGQKCARAAGEKYFYLEKSQLGWRFTIL